MNKAVKDDHDAIDRNNARSFGRNCEAIFGGYSETGAWGDLALASGEKGKIMIIEYLNLMQAEIKLLLADCLTHKRQQQ